MSNTLARGCTCTSQKGFCCIEILAFLIKFKIVILHTGAEFSEKHVFDAFAEDIMYDG
jgi:hypothetical protein